MSRTAVTLASRCHDPASASALPATLLPWSPADELLQETWEVERVTPPADVWVDERVAVADSVIEGRGLVAIAAIPEATVVIRLGGRLVSTEELAALVAAADADPAVPYVDTVTVHEDEHLVLPPASVAHHANHSCEPTLWHVGAHELATRHPLAAGDELTVDYATLSGADGLDLSCRCGSGRCRGRITSDDWRLPDLWERYGTHWTPALAARIAAQRASG